MAPLPLEGYRVLDMTEVWAGPMATSLLGDLGAEIIRIESFPRASMTRPVSPPPPGPFARMMLAGDLDGPKPWDRSPIYHLSNRNKLGITLNLRHEAGKDLFLRLVGVSDAFVVGYSAGTITNMGLDYETLRRVKSDLIMLSMPGWGERGPYQGYVTLGSGLDAWAGHYYLRGYPDLDPSETGQIYHSDATGALAVAFAILTALHHRDQTGKGQFIDLSQSEVLLTHLARPIMEWVMNNRVVPPAGNQEPLAVPHGAYPGKEPDSWLVIAVRNDDHWRRLGTVTGPTVWQGLDSQQLATATGRLSLRQAIDERLAAWTRQFSPSEAAQLLQQAGVPAGPVYNVDGPSEDTQLAARQFLITAPDPLIGPYRRPDTPWRMQKTPLPYRHHSNQLGEHNRAVLCGILGLSDEEFRHLEEMQVIGDAYKPGADVD